MKTTRVIARLDIKGPNLVKGVQFEGLRKLGDPNEFAKRYYASGIDEIIYVDIVASLYDRNSLDQIIKSTSEDVFVPITVGGGIRSVDDVRKILRSGADKVAINTAALRNPELISEVSQRFGSQCVVLSIQAKSTDNGRWQAYYDNGREKTGIDVVEWAKRGEELGAGEILLMSVDNEGRAKGLDLELVKAVTGAVRIPVIAGGGIGSYDDLVDAIKVGHADAVAMSHVLHYDKLNMDEIRARAVEDGISIRR